MLEFIATGLPKLLLNKIDREPIEDRVSLFKEVIKYELIINKKKLCPKEKILNSRNKY